MGPHEILVASVMVAVFFFGRRHLDAVREAIENFHDNFPGGPRTPMHPSPVNDAALLRRRRKIEG
jgi:hypothetical protein